MFTGSSALTNEAKRQISTPAVRLTLKENLNITSTTSFTDIPTLHDAIVWNDQIIFSGITGTNGVTQSLVIGTYANDGASQVNLEYIPAKSGAVVKFYDSGSTLLAFYTGVSNNNPRDLTDLRTRIYLLSSNDGKTWGGTQLIYTNGPTAFLSANLIDDLAPVGSTRMYFLDTDTVLSNDRRGAVNYAESPSGTWGSTEIYKPLFMNQGSYGTGNQINAAAFDNEDRVMIGIYDNSFVPRGPGVRILRTDGLEVREEFDLIDTTLSGVTADLSTMHMSNLTKGESAYYFMVDYKDKSLTTINDPSTDAKTIETKGMLFASKDLLNWQTIYTNITGERAVVFHGTSWIDDLEVGIMGLSFYDPLQARQGGGPYNQIWRGSSSLDISDNITSYSNQNNDRITLTLGNYK